jgi:hypothetical protein
MDRNKHCLRLKGWKNIYQANSPQKQEGVTILIPYKVYFKPKLFRRDEEGHFISIKGAIQQEEITIICIAPNFSVPNFIKHTLLDLKTLFDLKTPPTQWWWETSLLLYHQ